MSSKEPSVGGVCGQVIQTAAKHAAKQAGKLQGKSLPERSRFSARNAPYPVSYLARWTSYNALFITVNDATYLLPAW